MKTYLHRIFGLHAQRSIWVGEEDLGREKVIEFKHKRYAVKIPPNINQKAVVRLRGLGKTKKNQTGDLILAHELCHVIYSERISGEGMMVGSILLSEKGSLEQERTVDLLVFMFKIGEFQLRVARDTRLTLGYFHQEVFERMQVIVAKKLGAAHKL